MTGNVRKRVVVVAAVVVSSSGAVLCVRRGKSALPYISEKWEFPGGKVEVGEEREAALVREIDEELGIVVKADNHIVTVTHEYPDFQIEMHAYLCSALSESELVELREHIDYRWLDRQSQEFANLDWAAADLPIVERLRGELVATEGEHFA